MQQQSSESKVKALLYPITIPYKTVQSTTVFISSLSKLQLLQLSSKYISLPETLKIQTILLSLTDPSDIDKLIYADVSILYKKILEISSLSNEEYESISLGLDVIQDKKYQTPDFTSCAVCQERGLDKVRNCPMLDESTHNKRIIPYTFEANPNRLERTCPMYNVNNSTLLHHAVSLMQMVELGHLPVSGGLLEQTVFVNDVIPLIKPIIDSKKVKYQF